MSPSAPVSDRVRRSIALSLVLVLLALAAVANATVKRHRAEASSLPSQAVAMVQLSHRASSSAWYCPGPLPLDVGSDRAEIELANLSPQQVHGEVQIVTNRGQTLTSSVLVARRAVVRVALPTPKIPAYGAASVLLNGLGVGVTEIEDGPSGPVNLPCSTEVSSSAYLAGGTTRLAGNIALSLFDPGATPSVANVSFATATGAVAPPALQGIPLAAGQLVVENVGEYLPEQGSVATTVASSGGRIVVGALYSNVLARARTLALVTGLPSGVHSWYLAPAPNGGTTAQSFVVLNTSSRPTKVVLRLGSNLDTGTAIASDSVSAGGTALLSVAHDLNPRSLRWARISASNNATIIVERQTLIPTAINWSGPPPVKQKKGPSVVAPISPIGLPLHVPPGLAESTGTPLLSKDWLLGGGESDASAGEIIAVANPSNHLAHLRISVLGASPAVNASLRALPALQVVPGGALAIDLGRILGDSAQVVLVVSSSEPVSAGSALYARGSKGSVGFNASAGIPVE